MPGRRDPAQQRLQVTVADDDWGSSDDLIGSCAASLRGLCDGEPHDLALPVLGSLPESRLSLSMQFEPFTGGGPSGLRGVFISQAL